MRCSGIRIPAITLVCLTLAGVSGCRYWYKPGADADALRADQVGCRDLTGSQEPADAFIACMEERGWRVSGRQGPRFYPAPTEPPAGEAAAWAATPERRKARLTAPASPSHEREPGAATLDAAKVTGGALASWWKFGGTSDQLQGDQQACRQQVDPEANRTVGLQWQASPAFARCMADKGWRGGLE